jgi:hypothetical protein
MARGTTCVSFRALGKSEEETYADSALAFGCAHPNNHLAGAPVTPLSGRIPIAPRSVTKGEEDGIRTGIAFVDPGGSSADYSSPRPFLALTVISRASFCNGRGAKRIKSLLTLALRAPMSITPFPKKPLLSTCQQHRNGTLL